MEFTRLNPLTGEAASSAPAMKAADIPAIAAARRCCISGLGAQGARTRAARC